MDLYARRKNVNRIALTISVAAAGFGLMWLVLILRTLVYEGFSAVDWRIFSEMTPPPGADGGLLNAIFGSLAMTVVATVVGTPVGLLAGTFMAEYGKGTALANVVRFINDILLSALDRDRPLHLRDDGRANGALLGVGGGDGACRHRRAGG